MHPPLDVFGDASELLSALTPGGARTDSERAVRADPERAVVAVGGFQVASPGGSWRLRGLRRKARTQTLRSVAQMGSVAAVIALDTPHSASLRPVRALANRLAKDLPYMSTIRYGHHLPTVVVLVRGHKGRQKLVMNLRRGLFHHSDAYGGVVIEADDLPQPGLLPAAPAHRHAAAAHTREQ